MTEILKTKIVQAMTFAGENPVALRRVLLDEKGEPVIREVGKDKFFVTVDQ